jgi:hypothetical protein
MKKLFIVTLAVLFCAGAAYAVEYDYSGMINTAGVYINNGNDSETRFIDDDDASIQENAYDYMFFEMEFDSTLNIMPSDKTLIRLNWEIHDESFGTSPTSSEDKTGDDNIAFKRAFGQYKFDNEWTTQFGLMTGGAFGTAFGDNADGYYRVRFDGPVGIGKVGVIFEKRAERGSTGNDDYDAEKDDSDSVAAYLVTKAGDVTLQFLGQWVGVGDASGGTVAETFEDEDYDINVIAGVVAAMGSFGDIGFEAEAVVKDYSIEFDQGDPDDYTIYGLYGNAWMMMDAVKIGAMLAYGSYDDDGEAGFGFGEDFGPGYWVMDWDGFGSGNAEYYAATLFAVYADYAVSDALSLYGAVEYMMSNEEDTEWEDATGWILNASMSYKLADNVTYSIAGAYGQYQDGEWVNVDGDDYDDPDPFARVYHKIQINF